MKLNFSSIFWWTFLYQETETIRGNGKVGKRHNVISCQCIWLSCSGKVSVLIILIRVYQEKRWFSIYRHKFAGVNLSLAAILYLLTCLDSFIIQPWQVNFVIVIVWIFPHIYFCTYLFWSLLFWKENLPPLHPRW